VDETPSIEQTQQMTGNNVGKTTVLRLVDYCFGGDGKKIYKDTEFAKQSNTEIEKFLKEKKIIISIELVDDLENTQKRIIVKRNFLTHTNKIQEINGISITDSKEFDKKLKEEIFSTQVEKPSLRQIVSKNIRDEKNRNTNILKVLDTYTKKEEYEALYLFWLGISIDIHVEKQRLLSEKTKEESFRKRLRTHGEPPLTVQELAVVNKAIEKLNAEKAAFGINECYSEDIEELNQVKRKLNQISSRLSALEMRKELILESKDNLEADYTHVNTSAIEELYKKAHAFIQNLQKSFEDTVKFHNDLIREKVKYILRELPEIQKNIQNVKAEMSELIKQEDILTKRVQKSGLADELERVVNELNKYSEKKGELEHRKKLWEESDKKANDITVKLEEINRGIDSFDSLILERISRFNNFFSDLSNELYGEKYLLSHTKEKNIYGLQVTNLENNPSVGKKKGQIAAFDLAYIQFADDVNIPCLHFVMHDQLESIHDNQLSTLIRAANQMNGQCILSILRDKLPTQIEVGQYVVLSLSQNDKLFKQ
jgi:uncharacterized protein YydD (DUF2326 family)